MCLFHIDIFQQNNSITLIIISLPPLGSNPLDHFPDITYEQYVVHKDQPSAYLFFRIVHAHISFLKPFRKVPVSSDPTFLGPLPS